MSIVLRVLDQVGHMHICTVVHKQNEYCATHVYILFKNKYYQMENI